MPPTTDDGTPVASADPVNPDTQATDVTVTPKQAEATNDDAKGSASTEGATEWTTDLDEDTRDWLGKKGVKSAAEAAKLARDQSKLLGNAVRIPGENATDEERNEFLNKLGRPESSDGYELEIPKDLPEGLPYDADRAKEFRDLAHSAGLTATQAKAVHDWAAANAIGDFTGAVERQQAITVEEAKAETSKLEKLWGPLATSETAKANLTFADRFLRDLGGPELVESLQKRKLIGPNNEVLDAALAVAFAKGGAAVYREDDVLHGNAAILNNPYADGTANMTEQQRTYKNDPDLALQLIAAAGKKPEDFGLKAK